MFFYERNRYGGLYHALRF